MKKPLKSFYTYEVKTSQNSQISSKRDVKVYVIRQLARTASATLPLAPAVGAIITGGLALAPVILHAVHAAVRSTSNLALRFAHEHFQRFAENANNETSELTEKIMKSAGQAVRKKQSSSPNFTSHNIFDRGSKPITVIPDEIVSIITNSITETLSNSRGTIDAEINSSAIASLDSAARARHITVTTSNIPTIPDMIPSDIPGAPDINIRLTIFSIVIVGGTSYYLYKKHLGQIKIVQKKKKKLEDQIGKRNPLIALSAILVTIDPITALRGVALLSGAIYVAKRLKISFSFSSKHQEKQTTQTTHVPRNMTHLFE